MMILTDEELEALNRLIERHLVGTHHKEEEVFNGHLHEVQRKVESQQQHRKRTKMLSESKITAALDTSSALPVPTNDPKDW